jgi:hypothetical protein
VIGLLTSFEITLLLKSDNIEIKISVKNVFMFVEFVRLRPNTIPKNSLAQ